MPSNGAGIFSRAGWHEGGGFCVSSSKTLVSKILSFSDQMAEWSKAVVLGTILRAWVRIPLWSATFFSRPLSPAVGADFTFGPNIRQSGARCHQYLLFFGPAFHLRPRNI